MVRIRQASDQPDAQDQQQRAGTDVRFLSFEMLDEHNHDAHGQHERPEDEPGVQVDPQGEQRRQQPERSRCRLRLSAGGLVCTALKPQAAGSSARRQAASGQHARPHQHQQRHTQEQQRNHHRLQREPQTGDDHHEQDAQRADPAEAIAGPDQQQDARQGQHAQGLEHDRPGPRRFVQAVEHVQDPAIEPGMIDPRDRGRGLAFLRCVRKRIDAEGIRDLLVLALLH